MIRYLVFDFGRVLIRYEPDEITEAIAGREDLRLLSDLLFGEELWGRLDAGALTNEEATRLACARLPERLHAKAAAIYRDWIDHIPPIPGMQELVAELDGRGIPLYLLSNISAYFAENAHRFPVLSHFKKCIFSGVCRMMKPNREIYLHLLSECGIPADETLFIDDNPDNIAAARAVGIHGYLFDGDVPRLRAHLSALFGGEPL